jgi:phosphoribosyl-ATP pyrophosphohydrolase
MPDNDILTSLYEVLEARKNENANNSYVASLYAKGLDKILQKIGEESTETIIAAKNKNKQQIIHETADLWFHTMVMLAHLNISHNDIFNELEQRFGISGLDKKS